LRREKPFTRTLGPASSMMQRALDLPQETGDLLPDCLFEDSSGTLWSGTSAGLAFFASNRFQVPHESRDVLREQIVGMAEDKNGRFWIATSDHVLRVPRDKLLSGVVRAVDAREYDQADGLESTEGVKRSQSVVSDSAGRIWFSLRSGLSVVASSQITDYSVPALPHIESITADNYWSAPWLPRLPSFCFEQRISG
jgi:ligand-binding sensor domain-containing protein